MIILHHIEHCTLSYIFALLFSDVWPSLFTTYGSNTWLGLEKNLRQVDCPASDYDCARLGWRWLDGSHYNYPQDDWWADNEPDPTQDDTSHLTSDGAIRGSYWASVWFICEVRKYSLTS